MALQVEIEKTLGSFHLQVRFEAGAEVLALLGASGIVFMLIMRYEKKLELLNQSIQNIKEEVNELKNTTQNNRSLIEKNRSDIESINK